MSSVTFIGSALPMDIPSHSSENLYTILDTPSEESKSEPPSLIMPIALIGAGLLALNFLT